MPLDSERVKRLKDMGLVSDEFYNKVSGSQVATPNPDIVPPPPPEPVAAPAPPQDLLRKREIYNELANVRFMGSGIKATFDKDGKEPQRFETDLWREAESRYENESARQAAAEQAKAKKLADENEARQRAGLAPVQGAEAPATAPSAPSSVSASKAVPASYEQTPSVKPMQQQAVGGAGLLDVGLNKQRAGIQAEAKAAEAQGVRDASYIAGQQLAIEEHKNRMVDMQVQKQKIADEFVANQKKFDEQLAASQPKNWWAEQSTGVRIGAAIAIGLGQYSSAINGGPNAAMALIDSAIKRDMDRQRMAYEQLRDKKKDAQNLYGIQLARLGDQESAMNAMYATGLEKTKLMLQQSAAQARTEGAKAAAQKMIGEIEAKQGALYLELGVKAAAHQQQMDKDKRGLYVPHFQQFAVSEKGAQAMNELAAATNTATDGIKQLLAISQKGGKALSPTLRAEAETIAQLTASALRVPILGPGTVNDRERELMERIVQNPTVIFSLDAVNRVRLQTLMKKLDSNLSAQGKAYGLQPAPQAAKVFGTPRE
jgi:hypothetical protein